MCIRYTMEEETNKQKTSTLPLIAEMIRNDEKRKEE